MCVFEALLRRIDQLCFLTRRSTANRYVCVCVCERENVCARVALLRRIDQLCFLKRRSKARRNVCAWERERRYMCVFVALLHRIDQLCFLVCERERVYVCVRELAAFCRDTTQQGQTIGVCM